MYTKEDLKRQLETMGLTGKETILIHSSMKAIGEVEDGADTVLDAWMEYFADGLLLLPTHTWANVNAECPVYDYRSTPSCVGLLTNLFRRRDGVVRSLHPTHSLAGFGKGAAEYLAGEDENNTPCTPGGAYDRLKDCGGKILLVGVGHERNTYIHSVEEVVFGDAECLLCDAKKVFRVVRHVLAPDPECLVTKTEIPAERWRNFE